MAIGRTEWIGAALAALAKEGVEGIRVEALARKLKVTKGSFYWHFRDRPDLLEAVIAEWEEETNLLITEAAAMPTPRGRLERFLELVKLSENRIPETAIFMWARKDRAIAKRVRRTEEIRVAFLAGVLEAMNLNPIEAQARAELAYLTFVGMAEKLPRDPDWRERRDMLFARLSSVFLEAPANVRYHDDL